MQNSIDTLEQRIATLESQVAEAQSQNQPARAQMLQQQVDIYKKALATMQDKLNAMSKAPPKNSQSAAAPGGPPPRIPKRDAARIAEVPSSVLTDSELKAFLERTQASVDRRIEAKKRVLALQLYQSVKSNSSNAAALAASANGMWANKQPAIGLWLMGKAAIADPNSDNLNNYAAFLVMAGAPESGLPILMKLDQQYPGNSTILNNIGQAWFDLGDMDTAKKYLDQAVRRFPGHPQANYASALIEEARGNKPAAIAALKNSLRETYSQEREQELTRLGGFMDIDLLKAGFHMPQDPMGLHKFLLPRFPKNMDEAEIDEKEWEKFRDAISVETGSLDRQITALDPQADRAHEKRVQALLASAWSQGHGTLELPSPYIRRAQRIAQDATQSYTHFSRNFNAQQAFFERELRGLTASRNGQIDEIESKYEKEPEREGMDEQKCAEEETVHDTFIEKANALIEPRETDSLNAYRKYVDDLTYAQQYILDDEPFQVEKLRARRDYLSRLADVRPAPWCCGAVGYCHVSEKKEGRLSLANFDDIHCDKKVKLDMFLVQGEFTCNKATLTYDAIFFKGKQIEDLGTGEIISGTVEIMVSAGIGKGVPLGPVKGELRAGVGVSIDYDSGGITDVGIVAVAKGEIGLNLEEGTDPTEIKIGDDKSISIGDLPSVEAGIEARLGWNAGPSIHGMGLLGRE